MPHTQLHQLPSRNDMTAYPTYSSMSTFGLSPPSRPPDQPPTPPYSYNPPFSENKHHSPPLQQNFSSHPNTYTNSLQLPQYGQQPYLPLTQFEYDYSSPPYPFQTAPPDLEYVPQYDHIQHQPPQYLPYNPPNTQPCSQQFLSYDSHHLPLSSPLQTQFSSQLPPNLYPHTLSYSSSSQACPLPGYNSPLTQPITPQYQDEIYQTHEVTPPCQYPGELDYDSETTSAMQPEQLNVHINKIGLEIQMLCEQLVSEMNLEENSVISTNMKVGPIEQNNEQKTLCQEKADETKLEEIFEGQERILMRFLRIMGRKWRPLLGECVRNYKNKTMIHVRVKIK